MPAAGKVRPVRKLRVEQAYQGIGALRGGENQQAAALGLIHLHPARLAPGGQQQVGPRLKNRRLELRPVAAEAETVAGLLPLQLALHVLLRAVTDDQLPDLPVQLIPSRQNAEAKQPDHIGRENRVFKDRLFRDDAHRPGLGLDHNQAALFGFLDGLIGGPLADLQLRRKFPHRHSRPVCERFDIVQHQIVLDGNLRHPLSKI